MGAKLIGDAIVLVFPKLGRNHASRTVLTVMCHTAIDDSPLPVYYAGWRPLAAALGLSGTDITKRKRVQDILDQLEQVGVIRKVGDGVKARSNDTYLLQVRAVPPALVLIRTDSDNADVDEARDDARRAGG